MVDVNQTYCAVHFAIYTNIKLLCCIPETSMLYVNYSSIRKLKTTFQLAKKIVDMVKFLES